MDDRDDLRELDPPLVGYATRSLLRAVVDGVAPCVSLWLFWQLQDETSRLRVALVEARDRGRELVSRLGAMREHARFRRDVELDLFDLPTTTED